MQTLFFLSTKSTCASRLFSIFYFREENRVVIGEVNTRTKNVWNVGFNEYTKIRAKNGVGADNK